MKVLVDVIRSLGGTHLEQFIADFHARIGGKTTGGKATDEHALIESLEGHRADATGDAQTQTTSGFSLEGDVEGHLFGLGGGRHGVGG